MTSLFLRFSTLQELFASADEAPWEYTEEPHTSRRKEILRRHPEIKQLMGYDPSIAWIVLMELLIQLVMCWLVQDLGWARLVVVAYVISGTLNHSLGSAIHEIGHNLAYGHGHPLYNRALGMLCNLPMGVPLSVTYKKYHSDHHRFLGNPKLDADVPTRIECFLFRHRLMRIIWLILHPIIHGIRPFIKKPEPPTVLEIINIVVQLLFDVAIFQFLGVKSLLYLVGGTVLGLGLHPLAGHFISEHYMFTNGQATLSYYGPLNPILFNVGYHVEHHDFPYIAWRKLPDVKRIAPEFYDHLPHHTSWVRVLLKFILDPGMGPQGHGMAYLKAELDEMLEPSKMVNATVNWNTMNGVIMESREAEGIVQDVNLNGRVGHKKEHQGRVLTRSRSKAMDFVNNNGVNHTESGSSKKNKVP